MASIVLGLDGTLPGSLSLANDDVNGQSVLIQNLDTTVAYNFNLPATAGPPGYLLTSQGGGTNSMIWSTPGLPLPVIIPIRVVSDAGPVTVSATSDYEIVIRKTVAAPTTVNLPAAPPQGIVFVIKDGKGDANVNNIMVMPASGSTIDDVSAYVINFAYGVAAFVYNGTQWNQQ